MSLLWESTQSSSPGYAMTVNAGQLLTPGRISRPTPISGPVRQQKTASDS